jgi:hypothetical protein
MLQTHNGDRWDGPDWGAAMRLFRTSTLAAACVTSLVMGGLVLGWGIGPASATVTTYVVNTTVDGTGVGLCSTGGTCGLRQAIDQYNTDTTGSDTITFAVPTPATFSLLAGNGQLAIDNPSGVPLTITGAGDSDTIIDGLNAIGVLAVYAAGPITIQSVTIENGSVPSAGAGIYNQSTSLTLDQVTVSQNATTDAVSGLGGGIFNVGATLTLNDSTVSNNSVAATVGGFGGGIYNSAGTVFLNDSTVSGNSAGDNGGGIFNSGGTVALNSSAVWGNDAPNGFGGGIGQLGGGMTITSSTVWGNSAEDGGGGILLAGGTMALNLSTVWGNTTLGTGAGISSGLLGFGGTLTFNSSDVLLNFASIDGGAIWIGSGELVGSSTSLLLFNRAGIFGGGIDISGGTVILNGMPVGWNVPDNIAP